VPWLALIDVLLMERMWRVEGRTTSVRRPTRNDPTQTNSPPKRSHKGTQRTASRTSPQFYNGGDRALEVSQVLVPPQSSISDHPRPANLLTWPDRQARATKSRFEVEQIRRMCVPSMVEPVFSTARSPIRAALEFLMSYGRCPRHTKSFRPATELTMSDVAPKGI